MKTPKKESPTKIPWPVEDYYKGAYERITITCEFCERTLINFYNSTTDNIDPESVIKGIVLKQRLNHHIKFVHPELLTFKQLDLWQTN